MRWVVFTAAEYRVEKSWLGVRHVNYACPACGEPLKSPLSDAGRQDGCPTCNAEFVVPGAKEFKLQAESKRLASEAKQEETRLKQHAKLAAAERRAQLERDREAAARKTAEEESRREDRDAEEQAETPETTKSAAALSLGSGGGVAVIVLLAIAYATLLGPGATSSSELRSRVRETLREMEGNVPDTLRSIEANLPNVMEDMEANMMADADKYGLSPSDVRAQIREIESGARDQIRGMENEVREQIRGMEDDVVENLRASGW